MSPAETHLYLLRDELLRWYAAKQRELPWRRTRDPYAILVSEVMLQQTQVHRVVRKYVEFITRFPSFSALAQAPLGEVIRAWAPLGYNRRAVRLRRLAKWVMEQEGGCLPREQEALARLEGVGTYTAAAVACFAFDEQVTALDSNIRRVLSRLFADRLSSAQSPAREITALASSVLPVGRAADWNQALMDLGATVCRARAPACHRCPAAARCDWWAARRSQIGETARAVAEPWVQYRTEAPFLGSSRYYRGRIIERLRKLPPGEELSLDELGRAVRPDFGPSERFWLLKLVKDLASDELLVISAADCSSGDVWVSLP